MMFLCLLNAYIFLYMPFALSSWYLVGMILWSVLFSLFLLWRFIKKGKQFKQTEKVDTKKYGKLGFLVAIPIVFIARLNLGNPDGINIIMSLLSFCFLVFAVFAPFGIRAFVLPDDKMLYGNKSTAPNDKTSE